MKRISFFGVIFFTIFLFTCKSTKQSVSATPASPPPPVAPSEPIKTTFLALSVNGVYAPGEEELQAIQPYNKDITLDKLSKGYSLYSQSACIQCHPAKNIYDIKASDWNRILEDMSTKAMISNEQKDAVYYYVLAVKTVRLKQNKQN